MPWATGCPRTANHQEKPENYAHDFEILLYADRPTLNGVEPVVGCVYFKMEQRCGFCAEGACDVRAPVDAVGKQRGILCDVHVAVLCDQASVEAGPRLTHCKTDSICSYNVSL